MVSWLDEAISARQPFAFGELAVEPTAAGWRLQGPRSDADSPAINPASDALRRWVRSDDAGRYRPLSGALSLPSNWSAELPTDRALIETIEMIYPLATRHIAQAAAGILRTVALEAVLERQSGRYESSAGLGHAGRHAALAVVCGGCVRTPAWDEAAIAAAAAIPCPEPCGVMVSFCREAAIWEREDPSPAPVDPGVAFADFEKPGNELREAWLGQRLATTPGGAP